MAGGKMQETTGRAVNAVVRGLVKGRARQSGDAPPELRSHLPGFGLPLALLLDPIEFQRAGHEALGDVFQVSLFGLRLTFVGGRELLGRFVDAPNETLDLVGAYRYLFDRLLGAELFTEIQPEVMRVLSGASVRQKSGPLAELAGRFLRARLGSGGEIDVFKLVNDLVLHMACRFTCGDFVSEERCDELAHQFHVMETDLSIASAILPIETPAAKRRKAARNRILAIFEAEVRRAAASGDNDPDGYMQAVIRANLGPVPSEANDEQFRAAGLAIMGAVLGAHANTAMTLAACIQDLVEHPRVLAEVRTEQAVALDGRPMDLAALCRMPLLLRAMNESMRLRGNAGLWRMTRTPFELGGHTIPAGTLVGSSMGLVNLDPTLYPDPERYDPDRYREMKTDDFQSPPLKQRQLGAFGLGRHFCPGRGVAFVMVGAALTVLLRDYELQIVQRPLRWTSMVIGGMARPMGQFRIRATPVKVMNGHDRRVS